MTGRAAGTGTCGTEEAAGGGAGRWPRGSDAAHGARIVALFGEGAWDALLGNLEENESELSDYVSDYEGETGLEVDVAPGLALVRGSELGDPAFAAWCRARAEERGRDVGAGIAALVRGGGLTAWRAVEAPPGWDPRAAHPGIHWTYTRSCAQAVFGGGDEGHVTHVVRARLPLGSVDWGRTVAAGMSEEFAEGEDELTLRDGAPLRVLGVRVARG